MLYENPTAPAKQGGGLFANRAHTTYNAIVRLSFILRIPRGWRITLLLVIGLALAVFLAAPVRMAVPVVRLSTNRPHSRFGLPYQGDKHMRWGWFLPGAGCFDDQGLFYLLSNRNGQVMVSSWSPQGRLLDAQPMRLRGGGLLQHDRFRDWPNWCGFSVSGSGNYRWLFNNTSPAVRMVRVFDQHGQELQQWPLPELEDDQILMFATISERQLICADGEEVYLLTLGQSQPRKLQIVPDGLDYVDSLHQEIVSMTMDVQQGNWRITRAPVDRRPQTMTSFQYSDRAMPLPFFVDRYHRLHFYTVYRKRTSDPRTETVRAYRVDGQVPTLLFRATGLTHCYQVDEQGDLWFETRRGNTYHLMKYTRLPRIVGWWRILTVR